MTPEQFRRIRLGLGLKQVELMRLLDYKQPHLISYYETGARPIPHLLAMLMLAYEAGYRPDLRSTPDADALTNKPAPRL